MSAELVALGDQVQALCAASGLPIVGFSLMMANGEDLTTESRTPITRPWYIHALIEYVVAEQRELGGLDV